MIRLSQVAEEQQGRCGVCEVALQAGERALEIRAGPTEKSLRLSITGTDLVGQRSADDWFPARY